MEASEIEALAEGVLGPLAEFEDLELPELVRGRLARPADVPVDLRGDVLLGEGAVGLHVVDGALAGPALGVDPGVDHEAEGSPHLHVESAEVGVRVGVHASIDAVVDRVDADLEAEALGVEGPALAERGVAAEPADGVQVLDLLLDGVLVVVPGDRLVEGQRHHVVLGALVEAVGVGHEVPGNPALDRAGVVEGGGGVPGGEERQGPDAVGEPRQGGEEARHLGVDELGDVAVSEQQVFRVVVVEPGIGAEVLGEGAEQLFALELVLARVVAAGDDLEHLALELGDLVEADPVDLVGGQVERRVLGESDLVRQRAVEALGDAHRVAAGRDVLVLEEDREFLVHRHDLLGDDALGFQGHGIVRGQFAQRREEGAGRRVGPDGGRGLRERLGDRGLHDHARGYASFVEAAAHVVDLIADHDRHLLETLDPVGVVTRPGEGHPVAELREPHLRAAHRGDRHLPAFQRRGSERALQVVHEQVGVEAILLGEAGAIEPGDAVEHLPRERQVLGDRGGRAVAQAVVEAVVPELDAHPFGRAPVGALEHRVHDGPQLRRAAGGLGVGGAVWHEQQANGEDGGGEGSHAQSLGPIDRIRTRAARSTGPPGLARLVSGCGAARLAGVWGLV